MANRHGKKDHNEHSKEIENEAGLKTGGRVVKFKAGGRVVQFNTGGAVKKLKTGGKVQGFNTGGRLDKRARGGGVGADKNPFSSAHLK